MNTPAPIDVSRLKGILGNAKNLMNKVETGDYETGNVDPRGLTEDGVKEMQAEGIKRPATSNSTNGTYRNMSTSKMPDAIKKLMLEQPIPQLTGPSHTFDLDDVIDEKPMHIKANPKAQRKTIKESHSNDNYSDLITISESELDARIQSKLIEYLVNNFTKTLTEEVIKKTISTLIKEGKLAVKKPV